MFAATIVAGCVTFSCQAGRSEVVTAAARYSSLLVRPNPLPPPLRRDQAERQEMERILAAQLSKSVRYLQREAWGLWLRRAQGADPEKEVEVLVKMLQVHQDAMHSEEGLKHPHGMGFSYGVQSALLNSLGRECERTLGAARAAGRIHSTLTSEMEKCRVALRATFAPVIARIA